MAPGSDLPDEAFALCGVWHTTSAEQLHQLVEDGVEAAPILTFDEGGFLPRRSDLHSERLVHGNLVGDLTLVGVEHRDVGSPHDRAQVAGSGVGEDVGAEVQLDRAG